MARQLTTVEKVTVGLVVGWTALLWVLTLAAWTKFVWGYLFG